MSYIIGVDECGRGPIVGSVVACAVMVHIDEYNQWREFESLPDALASITDSKKLSEAKRTKAAESLRQYANIEYGIGEASAAEIDQINILQASLLAMRRAVLKLSQKPNLAYIDGNKDPGLHSNCETILCIKGDATVPLISAASILAKDYRDQQMIDYDKIYPQYLFAKHKGYPTKQHIELMQVHGITSQYRKSFAPVRKYLNP